MPATRPRRPNSADRDLEPGPENLARRKPQGGRAPPTETPPNACDLPSAEWGRWLGEAEPRVQDRMSDTTAISNLDLKIWRGDARAGELVSYRVPVREGMVVLDAVLW